MSTQPVFQVRGLNVTTTSFANEADFRAALAGPLSWGVNTLIIDLMLEQDGIHASTIRYSTDPYASFQRTQEVVRVARDMGFKVWIKPITFTAKTGQEAYEWNRIAPDNPAQWFDNYADLLNKSLAALQKHGIEAVLLGNELNTLVTQDVYAAYWKDLISQLRQVYPGQIGYNATAFSRPAGLQDEYSAVTFLDQLDLLGLSTYPQLYASTNPTAQDMLAGWSRNANAGANIIDGLRQFIQAHPSLKLALTEFGAPALDGGTYALAQLGFNVETPAAWVRDLSEQSLFFETGFQVLSREFGDQLMGMFPFRWGGNTYQGHVDTDPNRGIYTLDLQGKPAADVISAWYSGQVATTGTEVMGRQGHDRLGTGFYDDTLRGAVAMTPCWAGRAMTCCMAMDSHRRNRQR